jgi:hypothetical protein
MYKHGAQPPDFAVHPMGLRHNAPRMPVSPNPVGVITASECGYASRDEAMTKCGSAAASAA